MKRKTVFWLSITLLCAFFALNSLFIVYEGQQALIMQFGKSMKLDPLKPGLYMKIPFIQNVLIFDSRIIDMGASPKEVIASDQKRLIVDSYAKYRIINPLRFYQTVGTEKALQLRVRPIVESSIRGQVGTVSLIQLLKNGREKVTQMIHDELNKQVSEFGIEIVDIRIKRTDLPENNSEAIFNRMQTEREKEAREIRASGKEEAVRIQSIADKESNMLISDANMKARITSGEGDALAAEIYNNAYSKDPEFFSFIRHMEMYKKSFTGNGNKFILSGDESYLKYMNTQHTNTQEKKNEK